MMFVVFTFAILSSLAYGRRHSRHHGGGGGDSIIYFLECHLNMSSTEAQQLINETIALDLTDAIAQLNAAVSALPPPANQTAIQEQINKFGPPQSLVDAVNALNATQKALFGQLKSNGSYMALKMAIDQLVNQTLPADQNQARRFLKEVFFEMDGNGDYSHGGRGGYGNRHNGGFGQGGEGCGFGGEGFGNGRGFGGGGGQQFAGGFDGGAGNGGGRFAQFQPGNGRHGGFGRR